MSTPNTSRAAKPVARPAAKTAAKPATRAAAKPAAKPAVRAAAKPVAKPAAKTAAKKAASKPVAAAKPVIDTTKLYKLLTGVDDGAFCQKVTDHILAGYQLHGSPSITVKGGQVWAAQAVTRKPKPVKKGKKK